MNNLAFIGDGIFIYWSPIILVCAAVAAICFYGAMYTRNGRNFVPFFLSIPLCTAFSLPLSRLVHWYCQSGAYTSFQSAMTDFGSGGFALLGVFAGCILAAALLRLLRISDSFGIMLDCMSIGGGVGIALGRLGSLFSYTDLGMIVSDTLKFPFAYGILNPVSGQVDNRFATFMFQSAVTGLIVLLLLTYLLVCRVRKQQIPAGDIALIFLLCYGASQIVLDSTRYDHLVLRSNGFISMVQVAGLIAMLIPIILFTLRYVKNSPRPKRAFGYWAGILALFGAGGYMEYYVQNNQHKALFAYSAMSASLLAMILLLLVMRHNSKCCK